MKIPTFLYAMALCAAASAPTHAYVVYFDGVKAGEKPVHSGDRTSQSAQETSGWGIAESLQSIKQTIIEKKDALIEKLTAADSTRASRSDSTSRSASSSSLSSALVNPVSSNLAANVLHTLAPAVNFWRSDFHGNRPNRNATVAWEDIRVRPAALPSPTDNQIGTNDDFWLSELRNAESASLEEAELASPFNAPSVTDNDKWTLGADKIGKVLLTENQQASSPARATVAEPTSIGLMLLGISALILSRRKARSVSVHA